MRANLPDKTYFLGKTLPFRPDTRILALLGSGNNAHVFRAHSAELGRDVACKVIPRANLIGVDRVPPTWRAEVLKANRLQAPAAVKFFEIGEWRDGDNSIDCVVLISDYVEGKTLRSFIASNKDEVTVTFATGFLKSMLDFFFDMISKGVVEGVPIVVEGSEGRRIHLTLFSPSKVALLRCSPGRERRPGPTGSRGRRSAGNAFR